MKATTSVDTQARLNDDGHPVPARGQAPEAGDSAAVQGTGAGKPESELRAATRRRGLTMKELAARAHVDPMLALRTVVCSDRWEEVWPQISHQLREKARERRLGRWVRSRRPEGLEAKTDSRAQTSSQSTEKSKVPL